MAGIQQIGAASDRIMAALMSGLEIEFGSDAGEALAHRFLDAEEADFRWDARIAEHWLCAYEGDDDDDIWLDRVAIYGRLDGKWFAATMIVDGDGEVHGILACREFGSRKSASNAMMLAH